MLLQDKTMPRLFTEWGLHDLSLELTTAYHDAKLCADLAELRSHIAHTDTFLKARRHRSGSNLSDDLPFGIGNFIVLARNTLVFQFRLSALP